MSKIRDHGLLALGALGWGFGSGVRSNCADPQVTNALGGQVVTGPSEEMCLIGDLAYFGGILILAIVIIYQGIQWYKKRQNP
ncbi:MAG: hypothetical protein ACI977_000652 [Candidatus Nanohaloarchaea archaeon]|jgi:hypothetical protein